MYLEKQKEKTRKKDEKKRKNLSRTTQTTRSRAFQPPRGKSYG
jgi:hypothetical protein